MDSSINLFEEHFGLQDEGARKNKRAKRRKVPTEDMPILYIDQKIEYIEGTNNKYRISNY